MMGYIRFILILCFLLPHFHDILCNTNTDTDREALLSFKSELRDPKNYLSSWTSGSNPCIWNGVTCSEVGERVQYLTLSGLELSGKLPARLSNLTYLNSLDLSTNNLHGEIPHELGHLQRLQKLYLSNNKLTGKVPPSLGNLFSMKSLVLARNRFEGEIPTELGNLSSLSYLALSDNYFSGEFPISIFSISSLVSLSVTNNNLSGKLPQNFGHALASLTFLSLAINSFDGVIPNSISNASSLQYIDLANNKFNGPIPTFNNLINLTYLALDNNYLSSTTSLTFQFFDSLRNSTLLNMLRINDNHLAGELPSSFINMSSAIKLFHLGHNLLTGNFPPGIKKFQNLLSLSFENNFFSGELPSEMGALQMLQNIDIHGNIFSGEISDIFGNLTNLYTLAMGNNQFSGRIPTSIRQCKGLFSLDLRMNRLRGTIPKEIFQLSYLTSLNLAGNSLHGSLPPEVGTMTQLETLDLSSNNLVGPIPVSLENLHYLQKLNLSFNHLEGEVPVKGLFTNLTKFDLRGNNQLCSLNKEIVQNSGVLRCVVGKKKRKILLPTILAVVGATALFISMLFLFWTMKKERKERKTSVSSEPFRGLPQNITYGDIRIATDNFAAENLIGKGAFGSVYKGVFSFSAGETATLAVKVLDLQQSKASKSFNAECEALKNVRHRNLVKVITSCSSLDYNGEEFKALVMQFMPNGNLDLKIHPGDEESGSILTLMQRLSIAIDVASAVEYLHHDCHPPIAHCDLKPANVLLDENMTAHVVDFGLARFLSRNTSEKQSSTLALKGSIGYIAPEYGFGSKASTEGDVYSFGILVLEMFTGKRPTDEMFKEGLSLRKFVSAMDENEVVMMGGDRRLIEDYGYSTQSSISDDHSSGFDSNTHCMRKAEECIADVIRVGLSCTAYQPKERWSMREALSKLQAINHSMLPF